MIQKGYNSHMKRASISEAKNRLSALLDRVRQGATVVIEDRGVPIARLEPITAAELDPEGRVLRLERQGLLRRPAKAAAKSLLSTRPPRPRKGRRASDIILEERRNGR
jgi:prevent-host-death family protein